MGVGEIGGGGEGGGISNGLLAKLKYRHSDVRISLSWFQWQNLKYKLVLFTDLIGVKSEKEPLTGIGPVKLLFDKSLHCEEWTLVPKN